MGQGGVVGGLAMMIMMTMMGIMDGWSKGDDDGRLLFWSGFIWLLFALHGTYGVKGWTTPELLAGDGTPACSDRAVCRSRMYLDTEISNLADLSM